MVNVHNQLTLMGTCQLCTKQRVEHNRRKTCQITYYLEQKLTKMKCFNFRLQLTYSVKFLFASVNVST